MGANLSDPTPSRLTPSNDHSPKRQRTLRGTTGNGQSVVDIAILNKHLGYFVRRLQVWIFQDFIRTLRSVDIRPAQFSVLVVVEANPGLSQSELADLLGIERGRMVWLLDSLEKRRFIRRLPSTSDRRSHALQLTNAGQKRMKKIKALAAEHEARLVERVGAQRWEVLIGVLKDFDPSLPTRKDPL